MAFYAYLLRCRDGTYYAGHTEDLEVRLAQHQRGTIPGYTHDRRPVTLVWCHDFPTRDEAFATERRIKGWSRAKKEAWIAGDWNRVSMLARNRQEEMRPSTSSGRAGVGLPAKSIIQRSLQCHPANPARAIERIDVRILQRDDGFWLLEYIVFDPERQLLVPAPDAPERSSDLWRTTCFELFVRDAALGYREYNFSPSTRWAAYQFDGYRAGMRDAAVSVQPDIAPVRTGATFAQLVSVEAGTFAAGDRLGLSAVIEEPGGTISYWALAHPDGKADFHDPACFALTL